MTGSTVAFIEIEIMVYFSYISTLVILMLKQNFKNIGIDNTDQFDDTYMSYLANMIVRSMVFKGDKINPKFISRNYVGKRRTVEVDQVTLKVRLTLKDFDIIKEKVDNQEKLNFVEVIDSQEWIKNNLVGSICKRDLDQQRLKESNGLDQMQNTSFIYHPESLIEMQIICTMAILYY